MTRYFTKDHEWIDVAGDTGTVGISDYAQGQLGDVVFVELPAVGTEIAAGAVVGEIESTKSVSDIFAPVSGVVTSVNDAATDDPESIGDDPYGEGWLFDVELADPSELDDLLDADGYAELIGE